VSASLPYWRGVLMNKNYGTLSLFTILITVTCCFLTCVESPKNEKPIVESPKNEKPIVESDMNWDETPVKVVLPEATSASRKDSLVPAGIRKEAKEESLEWVDVRFSILMKGVDVAEIWLGHDIGFVTAVRKSFKITDDNTCIWRGSGGGGGLGEVSFVFSNVGGRLGGVMSARYRNRTFQVNTIKGTSLHLLWEADYDALPPFRDVVVTGE